MSGKDPYPIFRALGAKQEFLDAEAAIAADRDTRIRSIWPYIARRAKAFYKSLTPRERVNFDPEDIATELWVALAAKDSSWAPERGKYLTFAGTIIERELYDIRDRARTIESPRNSSLRMKEYLAEEAAGTITPRRRQTAEDIRRTGSCGSPIGGPGDTCIGGSDDDPAGILADHESHAECLEAIKLAIRALTPREAVILGSLAGLWGRPQQTAFWVAWRGAQDPSEIRQAKAIALRKIREHLRSLNHPAATLDD